ncbi:MAG: ABC transporter permease, partial [Acidimicrobiia bacterium]|nr:ABC transporter permease [Acidimicrobiia bacterium]
MGKLAELTFWTATFAGGMRLATPLIFASLGETIAQRAGVLNIGLEGFMIIGALTSLYVTVETGIAVGLLAGALAGAVLALLMVWLCVRLNANQVVVGFGITILGVGLTGYIFHLTTPLGGERRQVGILGEIHIPGLSDIPFLGEAFLSNSWMTWLALGLVPIVWWVAQRTVFGLEVRAVGEDPDAAFARGVDVIRVRSIATLISGLLAGLGGAAITTALVGVFEPAITAGRGFIALIVIIMVRWSAWGVAVGSFAFGLADALGTNLRNIVSDSVPTEALQMIPFFVAL